MSKDELVKAILELPYGDRVDIFNDVFPEADIVDDDRVSEKMLDERWEHLQGPSGNRCFVGCRPERDDGGSRCGTRWS